MNLMHYTVWQTGWPRDFETYPALSYTHAAELYAEEQEVEGINVTVQSPSGELKHFDVFEERTTAYFAYERTLVEA